MKAETIQEKLAGFFCERGVEAIASWPEEARTDADYPVVLVSLEQMSCASAGLQDYLGQHMDEVSGQEKELYGRRAQMTFMLDILASPKTGAKACRTVFDRLLFVLQEEKPLGLRVWELTGDEMEYDGKEGLLRLRCHLVCAGWLYTTGKEAGTFLDFTLRGDINT